MKAMTEERLRELELIYHFPPIETYPGELIAEVKRLKEENDQLQIEVDMLKGQVNLYNLLMQRTVDDIVQNMKNADIIHEDGEKE